MTDDVLEAKDITVRFGGLIAVDDIDLSVSRGEIVGVIGPNGAGKSTLFNVISGTVQQTEGTVHLLGQDVSDWPIHRRAVDGMSRTFQLGGIVEDLTVLEHIALGIDHRARIRGERLSRKAIIEEAMDRLEGPRWHGRHHQYASELSAGYKREIEILRALVADPAVVLLDEPTVGLGMADRSRIAELLRQLADGGMGFLITDHDTDIISNVCDRVLAMDFGKQIAHGPPQFVLEDERVLKSYLGGRPPEMPERGQHG